MAARRGWERECVGGQVNRHALLSTLPSVLHTPSLGLATQSTLTIRNAFGLTYVFPAYVSPIR